MKAEPRPSGEVPAAGRLITGTSPTHRVRWSGVREICELLQVPCDGHELGDTLRFPHRKLRPGQVVYREGQPFEALYLVMSGFLKTQMTDATGAERVTAFPARRELLGLDGIGHGRYACEVRALTDCELVALPFPQLTALGRSADCIGQAIHRAMSQELLRAYQTGPGVMRAEAKVARFIEAQTERYAALGYSPHRFLLVMTRRDIGSYLGLTLETVSRALSALCQAGVIAIRLREVEVLKPDALASWQRHDDWAVGKAEAPVGVPSSPPAPGWWGAAARAPTARHLQ